MSKTSNGIEKTEKSEQEKSIEDKLTKLKTDKDKLEAEVSFLREELEETRNERDLLIPAEINSSVLEDQIFKHKPKAKPLSRRDILIIAFYASNEDRIVRTSQVAKKFALTQPWFKQILDKITEDHKYLQQIEEGPRRSYFRFTKDPERRNAFQVIYNMLSKDE